MKKFQAILFPVTNITKVTKGKSMINQPFQHLQCEMKVLGFFAGLCRKQRNESNEWKIHLE